MQVRRSWVQLPLPAKEFSHEISDKVHLLDHITVEFVNYMCELCGVLILMYVCGRCISKTLLQAKRGSMWGVYFVPWFVFFRHRNELSRKKIAAPNNSSFLGNWPTFVSKPFSGPRRRPSKLFNGHYFCCFLSFGLKATFISFWAVVVAQW